MVHFLTSVQQALLDLWNEPVWLEFGCFSPDLDPVHCGPGPITWFFLLQCHGTACLLMAVRFRNGLYDLASLGSWRGLLHFSQNLCLDKRFVQACRGKQ